MKTIMIGKEVCTGNNNHESGYVKLLKVCAVKKDLAKGTRLHKDVLERGFLEKSPQVSSALINMYAKCGMLSKASKVLQELSVRDVVTWNSLIAGYTQQKKGREALHCFEMMQKDGLTPDVVTFTCILNACGSIGANETGKQIHDNIVRKGLLQNNIVLGNALVDMYAKCGMFMKAQQVLEELPVRNVITWNTLICAFVQRGEGHKALRSFFQMQEEGISPDGVTFTCILKACGIIRAVDRGIKIHDEIRIRRLLDKNIVLGNALVDMYAKCGQLTKATQVLEELPVRNVVSWSTLISGYNQEGLGHEALSCFTLMQWEGISPNGITFTSVLKACGITGDIENGKQIHKDIVNQGLLKHNTVLGNALVDMYCKCCDLPEAQRVLDDLPVRDIFSWSALISGYTGEGQGHEALNCFARMQREGLSPDGVTFTSLLKACGNLGDVDVGQQIHYEIENRGLLKGNVVLGTALVDMYAKCGVPTKAQEVLEELHIRNAVSWSALISGYSQRGQPHEALHCFEKMQKEGLSPDAVTFICILNACGSIGATKMGKRIHDEIVKQGLLDNNITLGNALVDMYAKCGLLAKAHEVLEELPVQDIGTWNSLITGYAHHCQGNKVLDAFEQLQMEGLSPDAITFACILKACSSIKAADKGAQIHHEIVNKDILKENCLLGTALVDMYAKGGVLAKAQNVFEELPIRDVWSWSALIMGYVQAGESHRALDCFEEMQREGICPNEVTLISILKAFGSLGALSEGVKIHDKIQNMGLLEKNTLLSNTLVDMYGKCGALQEAREMLKDIPSRNVVSWNSLIASYAEQGQGQEVLNCFSEMEKDGISPNDITFTCILKACGSIGAIETGTQIHNAIVRETSLEQNIILSNALVDMYVKCGLFAKAREVLEKIPVRDAVTWSSLISGYAQQGYYHEALACFQQMQREGVCANAVTFLSLLNACSHAGKSDHAQTYYETMSKRFGIAPTIEHCVCMVVLFGYAGCFDKALSIIKTMPYEDDPSVWLALLSGCKKWGNFKVGRFAFDQILILDDSLPAAYVLMIHIYMAAGMQEYVMEIENMRAKNVVFSNRQVHPRISKHSSFVKMR